MRKALRFIPFMLIAILAVASMVAVIQPFVLPLPSQPPEVDSARLAVHVKRLSVDLYPRSYDQFQNIELAAKYIHDEFKAAGAEVSVQEVTVNDVSYKNIVAHYGPRSGPLLVIGAHYDSHGDSNAGAKYQRGYDPETHTPGADDNASGVAGLIELAHLLGRGKQTRPIDLVAYTLEEPPHFGTENMGSVWHARSLAEEKRDVSLMLSLEMIGYFSEESGSQSYPIPGMAPLYSDRGDFISLVGPLSDFNAMRRAKAIMTGATDLPVHSVNAPSLVMGIDFSDHRSYWSEGYSALMITDTAFLRNKNYHKAGDTLDTLDYRRMAKVVQAVYAITQSY